MTRYGPLAPKSIWTIPKGKIAIHNHADHHVGQKSGENGFRVWFDDPHHEYVECSCGWRSDLGPHYQIGTHHEGHEARKMIQGWRVGRSRIGPPSEVAR